MEINKTFKEKTDLDQQCRLKWSNVMKSAGCLSKSVNNMNIRSCLIILLTPIFLISCQKNIYIPVVSPEAFHVNEKLASQTRPSQFYLCGDNCCPCHPISNKWSAHRSIKSDVYLNPKNLSRRKVNVKFLAKNE